MEIYIDKLHGNQRFPMPLKLSKKNKDMWHNVLKVLGKHFRSVMKTISQSAALSRTCTNNCVRVTVVTELKEHGFSNDQIASDTGHKSSDTAAVYGRR